MGFFFLEHAYMKNSEIIVGAGIGIVLLGLLIWFSQGASSPADTGAAVGTRVSQGNLIVQDPEFDFGSISMAKGKVSHRFTVKNTGDAPVTVRKIYTSCMCTTATLLLGSDSYGPYGMPGHGFIPQLNKEIPAGGAGEIEVVFDPAAHGPAGVGKIQRIVTIEQGGGTPVSVGFSALVTP